MSTQPSPPHMQFLLTMAHARVLDFMREPAGSRLLNALAFHVAKLGLWEKWASTCEALHNRREPDARSWLGLWLRLEAARQRRWDGDLAASFRLLREVVEEAGGKGFFDLYGRGLLEMSIIASLREEWLLAAETSADAEQSFVRLEWDAEAAQAVLVGARAIMPTDPEAALQRVEPLTSQYDNAASLACEISMALGKPAEAVDFATQAVELTEPETPNYGRALSMLALSLHADGQIEDALDCQLQAINVLNLVRDVVGLARGYNNLGVIYHALDNAEQGCAAWKESLARMLALQDAAGLDAVRANVKLLCNGDFN